MRHETAKSLKLTEYLFGSLLLLSHWDALGVELLRLPLGRHDAHPLRFLHLWRAHTVMEQVRCFTHVASRTSPSPSALSSNTSANEFSWKSSLVYV